MIGPVPANGVIEFEGYMKNKVNNKHVIIFSRAPKLVATPCQRIGDPLDYEKREERGDFQEESKIVEIEKIDISVPQKKVELQPMDANDLDGATKLNQKDIQLLDSNNPEINPFSVSSYCNNNNTNDSTAASDSAAEKFRQSPSPE